jgi:hypothetical protein
MTASSGREVVAVPGEVAVAVPRLVPAWCRRSYPGDQAGGRHPIGLPTGIRRDGELRSFRGRSIELWRRLWVPPGLIIVTEVSPHRYSYRRAAAEGSPVGTKTITMYVSDIDQSEIPAGKVYQLSIRHPDGATQQLDISEKNYRALKLQNLGKTLKKRGRKPGSTTKAAKATKAASTSPTRRRRRPATA